MLFQDLDYYSAGKGRRSKKIESFVKEREKTLLFLGEDRNAFWLVRCTTKARNENSLADQPQRMRHAVAANARISPQTPSLFF
jgi:hypothetical protein